MQVKEILAVKGSVLYTINPERSLSEAVSAMSEQDMGSLVCFSGGRMVGMLTFREVLKAIHRLGAAWQSAPVADVMLKEPVVGRPEMEVGELRQFMIEKHMRYLPVVDADTLLGVISFHDVAKAMLEEQSFENKMLKAYIRDWPADTGADTTTTAAK